MKGKKRNISSVSGPVRTSLQISAEIEGIMTNYDPYGKRTVVLYGCETWSLTVREEHRLRVFENRVLRIFGLKRDEVTGGCRKLHEELHNLYASPSIIRMTKSKRMRWAGHVARVGREGMHIGY
jgi:hypothetical protein